MLLRRVGSRRSTSVRAGGVGGEHTPTTSSRCVRGLVPFSRRAWPFFLKQVLFTISTAPSVPGGRRRANAIGRHPDCIASQRAANATNCIGPGGRAAVPAASPAVLAFDARLNDRADNRGVITRPTTYPVRAMTVRHQYANGQGPAWSRPAIFVCPHAS